MGVPVELSSSSKDPYRTYASNGGILDESLFHTVKNQAGTLDIKTLLPATRAQARCMANGVGLELLPQTLVYYEILCGFRLEKFAHLSDQELLAQALLLNCEIESYKRFTSSLSNIFR